MKKIFKMSGIIFLLAVICFALVTCDEDNSIGSKVNVSGSSLAKKIEWVKSHRSSGTTYTIEVTADEEISGYEFTSGSNRNMTIILNGNGKTISLKNDAIKWLFMVGDNVTLVLNNIILKGHDHNRASLVMVIGTLIMNDGTKIIDNKNYGHISDERMSGGVCVNAHGTFIMNGGEISGNTVSLNIYGDVSGGVFVGVYGIFTMNGGKITNNTGGGVCLYGSYLSNVTYEYKRQDVVFTMNSGEISGNNGSGVSVKWGGIFTMNGGEISGNSAERGGGVFGDGDANVRIINGTIYGSNAVGDLKNTASSGAALYYYSSVSAQYGTFNGDTWISKGNLSSTNDTVKVVNGELQ
jgi:hypothetical protein